MHDLTYLIERNRVGGPKNCPVFSHFTSPLHYLKNILRRCKEEKPSCGSISFKSGTPMF